MVFYLGWRKRELSLCKTVVKQIYFLLYAVFEFSHIPHSLFIPPLILPSPSTYSPDPLSPSPSLPGPIGQKNIDKTCRKDKRRPKISGGRQETGLFALPTASANRKQDKSKKQQPATATGCWSGWAVGAASTIN